MNPFYSFPIFSLVILLVSGCTPRVSPAQRAELNQEADLPIMCKAGTDCEEKWSRAGLWVTEHSAYKVRIHSDTLIQTEGPVGMDNHAAFIVTKTLDNDNIYSITFKVTCNNWFGCGSSVLEDSADFVKFVTASPVEASKTRLGARVHPLSASTAQAKGIPGTSGVVAVVQVAHNSIADKAGLQLGDVIVQYNGKPVTTEDELRELVANALPGQKVNILIYRHKHQQTLIADM